VNFVTCHDGFTLWDLVSYNDKHNEANGEDNRDGASDNHSWNWGAEGETADPAVNALRRQVAKNYLCALFLSAGTPMLLGGDEMLRTQRGNNNAYCQDNEIAWFDWKRLDDNRATFEFVRKLIAFTERYPALRRRTFFSGKDENEDARPDIRWYGQNLDNPAWQDPECRTIAYQLDGYESDKVRGNYLLFVIFNADWTDKRVAVPDPGPSRRWRRVIDTSLPPGEDFADPGSEPLLAPQDAYVAKPRSTVVLLGDPAEVGQSSG
jgi:isoamylase